MAAVEPLAPAERGAVLAELRTRCLEGRASGALRPAGLATGFASLDAVLPGGGWPRGAVTELLGERAGIGELSLLLPALIALARAGRTLACVAPPHLPYAPALQQAGLPLERLLWLPLDPSREALWAAEQLLRCPAVGAVLLWPAVIDERQVRRLQLAAETGGGSAWLYRPAQAAEAPSPAALRLRLHACADGLRIEILKSRGRHAHALVVHPVAAA
jgi:hypothetical protein